MTAEAPSRRHSSVPFWRNVRVLRLAVQIVIVSAIALLALWLWNNLTAGMARSNLTFGLDFLDRRAGFDIGETLIPYTPSDSYGRALAAGLLNTLLISIVGIVLATLLGILTGVARLSRNWLVNKIAAGYVEVMRNTPLLVQLVLIWTVLVNMPTVHNSVALPGEIYLNQRGLYLPRPIADAGLGGWLLLLAVVIGAIVVVGFISGRRAEAGHRPWPVARIGLVALAVAAVGGWLLLRPVAFDVPVLERFNFVGGVVLSTQFTALLFGLVIYTAAFIGEVVRGGIQAVRRGQVEAAYAIGLTPGQTLRLIVFPQALRIIVPPLTSQYLNLAKNSSLAIAIGFPDLFSVSRTMMNQTGQAVAVIVLVMGIYLAISLFTSLLMNIYNRRVQVLER